MPMAVLLDATLNYRLDGLEGAPVVVLSNSLGTEMGMWDAQVSGLAERFRVLRYDTRGHGESRGRSGEYTLDDLGGDVLGLVDALGIDRFHVCGISLGGMTALWLGIHAPARVLRLMACNTAARIGDANGWNARIGQIGAHGMASIADATMARWFTERFRGEAPAEVERTRRMLSRTDAAGYMACCAALRDADLTEGLASIVARALVISGTHDPVTPPGDGLALQRGIEGSRYLELDASHLSNVEQPVLFLDGMVDFLAEG